MPLTPTIIAAMMSEGYSRSGLHYNNKEIFSSPNWMDKLYRDYNNMIDPLLVWKSSPGENPLDADADQFEPIESTTYHEFKPPNYYGYFAVTVRCHIPESYWYEFANYMISRLSANDASYFALLFARNIIRRPWPDGEAYIITRPWNIWRYAVDVLHRRWPEAEQHLTPESYPYYEYWKIFRPS